MKKNSVKVKSLVYFIIVLFISYMTQSFSIIGYSPDFETEYKIKTGDSLSKLSFKYYSIDDRIKGAHWIHIYAYSIEKKYIDPIKQPVISYNGFETFVKIFSDQKLAIPFFDEEYPPISEVFKSLNISLQGHEISRHNDKFELSSKKDDLKQNKEELSEKNKSSKTSDENKIILDEKKEAILADNKNIIFKNDIKLNLLNILHYVSYYDDRAFVKVNISPKIILASNIKEDSYSTRVEEFFNEKEKD